MLSAAELFSEAKSLTCLTGLNDGEDISSHAEEKA